MNQRVLRKGQGRKDQKEIENKKDLQPYTMFHASRFDLTKINKK
jgi:hypothetical protein